MGATACAMCGLILPGMAVAEDTPAGLVDVGARPDIARGITTIWLAKHRFFLVREADRIYAPSAICSHKRAILKSDGDSGFTCPKHGSVFSSAGKPLDGPAKAALPRHAIRIDERGHVLVDPARAFAEEHWDAPQAFVRAE